ncbi:PM20D1 [Branchiostoma lanceolatum]|uniref:PM20D1 protein n=1 Tax=Branchiostoma lanceolatum TaxID=7740 RepID=A0A8J9VG88_BRALA|nr:PM20D1 [Branchiostoma lanceolatum]
MRVSDLTRDSACHVGFFRHGNGVSLPKMSPTLRLLQWVGLPLMCVVVIVVVRTVTFPSYQTRPPPCDVTDEDFIPATAESLHQAFLRGYGSSLHQAFLRGYGSSLHQAFLRGYGSSLHQAFLRGYGSSLHQAFLRGYGSSLHQAFLRGYGSSLHQAFLRGYGCSLHQAFLRGYGSSLHQAFLRGYGSSLHQAFLRGHGPSLHQAFLRGYGSSLHQAFLRGYGSSLHQAFLRGYGSSLHQAFLRGYGSNLHQAFLRGYGSSLHQAFLRGYGSSLHQAFLRGYGSSLHQAFLRELDRLGRVITFRTISYGPGRGTPQELLKLADFIRDSFPLLHSSPLVTREVVVVGNFSLLYRVQGSGRSLNPGLLAAHLDVVPVTEEPGWEAGPFSGQQKGGFVYGRGTMDTKQTLMGSLEVLEFHLKRGHRPRRTLYLAFGHDEEVLGHYGAQKIAELLEEREVKLEFVVDEGFAVTKDFVPGVDRKVALLSVTEKGYLTVRLSVRMKGGHGSMPEKESAIGVLSQAVTNLERNPQPNLWGSGPERDLAEHLATEMSLQPVALRPPLAVGSHTRGRHERSVPNHHGRYAVRRRD